MTTYIFSIILVKWFFGIVDLQAYAVMFRKTKFEIL